MSDNPETSRQNIIRDARREIVRSFFLALAALGVIVFACYAWFVSSSSVTATGMSATMRGNDFELASIGSDSVFTGNTPESYVVEDGAVWKNNGKHTAGKDAIVWQLNSGSHLNNIGTIDSGISPGSYGTLQFYVISKVEGSLYLDFDLELIPILNDEMVITDQEKETLDKLMQGHMLFSYQYADDPNSVSTPTLIGLENASFPLRFDEVEEGQEILVTLRWIWPYVLGDITGGNLHDVCNSESVISLMKDYPSYFFYDGSHSVTTSPDLTNRFKEYSNYFNAADQFLGERLQWLIVRLTAQTA